MMRDIKNKVLIFIALFTNLGVYGNDSVLINRVWTERQTIFVNKAKLDSVLDDSVIEYNGIGCGYGRCKEIYFFRNHLFRKINVDGDTLIGKWKLKGEVLIIKYDRRYRGQKRSYKFILKYKEKDYPTIFLFSKRMFDCIIYCNY